MDCEQEEMQFLGLFGVYRESYRIIYRQRKLFSQITLSLILPLSFLFLAHIGVSDILLSKIVHNEEALDNTSYNNPSRQDKLSDVLSAEWAYLLVFKAIYFTFFLVFSLLSTSAVVYSIACIYTGRELSLRKVLSVVPKVWKRLMVTFLCAFALLFGYHVVSITVLVACALTFGFGSGGQVLLYILFAFYVAGLVYLSIIWHLASVVSVLEDLYGVKAMMKSKDLIKGKMLMAIVIFFKLNLALGLIQFGFKMLVVYGEGGEEVIKRVFYGIICFLLLFKLMLFGLVIQTVIYFVCKSYHHENIDKSALADHLEVYLGEYEPLKARDVQLEQYQAV